MKKSNWATLFQVLVITLGVSIGIFFSIRSNSIHNEEHGNLVSHSGMDHGLIEVGNDSIIPEIENVEVYKDPMSGWNLHLATHNFQFTPQNAGSEHIPGKGHAHLLINGEKVARVYSNWFHIPQLEYEINELEVTLNANSHATMSVDGNPISIKLTDLESGNDLLSTKGK